MFDIKTPLPITMPDYVLKADEQKTLNHNSRSIEPPETCKEDFEYINNCAYHMTMSKSQDELIFSCISSYIHDNYSICVNKQELAEAVQYIRTIREVRRKYGCEKYMYDKVSIQELDKAYERGYKDCCDNILNELPRILERR